MVVVEGEALPAVRVARGASIIAARFCLVLLSCPPRKLEGMPVGPSAEAGWLLLLLLLLFSRLATNLADPGHVLRCCG